MVGSTKRGQTMRSVIDPCSWHQNLWFSRSNFCWPHGHITKVVTLLILTSGTALFETLRHHQLLSSEMLIGGCNNPKIRSKMGWYIYIYNEYCIIKYCFWIINVWGDWFHVYSKCFEHGWDVSAFRISPSEAMESTLTWNWWKLNLHWKCSHLRLHGTIQ